MQTHHYIFTIQLVVILCLIHSLCTFRVYLFYSPECSHCHKMMPEWQKFKSNAAWTIFPHILALDINIKDSTNKHIYDNFDISGVPHIVKLKYTGERIVFTGERTAKNIMDWCSKY